jgi:glycosyltransferase involved in cell wall biosynthesis
MPRRRVIPNTITAVGKVATMLRGLAPEVVNPHSGHYAVASLRAGLPTVLTVHGVPFREAPSYAHRGLAERLRLYMEMYYSWLAMRRVEHAIAISPYVMREYEGKTRARWHRIDNPLPDDFFSLENREEASRVLFVGTITEVKDILTLLRAFRELLPATVVSSGDSTPRLRLAGRTTSPRYEQTLRTFVSENNLQGQVEFLGMLDRERLLNEYSECAVVVLPSRQENAPMAVIEAMAAGKPVVATRVGGIPDLVADGETGLLVDAGSSAGIARSLERLLGDRALRLRMGTLARKQAGTRFRLQQVALKYREVYYLVASESAPQSRDIHERGRR